MLWTCKRWARLLGPYSENALPEKTAARLGAHLAACPACREELATLRRMAHLLREHKPPVPEPAGDLWSRVHAQIAPARPAALPRSLAWAVPATAIAALVLFFLARSWMGREATGPRQEARVPSPAARPATKRWVAARSPLPVLRASRPDPFRPLPERETIRQNPVESGRTKIASARSDRGRVRASRRTRVRSRVQVAAKEPSPTSSFAVRFAETATNGVSSGFGAEATAPRVKIDRISRDPTIGAAERTSLAAAELDAAPHPPVVTAAVDGNSPMPHVSAADSAVDEALDAQRQRELFRYSMFSRR